jgi:serine protease Do
MKSKKIFFGTISLFVGLIIGLGIAARFDFSSRAQSQAAKPETPAAQSPMPSFEGFHMEDAVINVASTTGKAVVSISAEHVTKLPVRGGTRRFYFNMPEGESPFGGEDPFRKFFDDFFGEMPDKEFKQYGLGSGVIIDSEGYILTNQHVVEQADKLTVILPDGRKFKAEIKGEDARSDLAVIKINARNLPFASLGDSDKVKIGQWVVAIGNPFGFALQNTEPTVTAGVISALHRSLGRTMSRDKDFNDLIQTDATINPGNSGGPLVDLKGEVVGINVAIFSTTGGSQGIGFAIPINNAKRIVSRLIEGKKIQYGWLAVTVQDLTEDLAKYFGLSEKNGALVVKVLKDGPAEKAGIKNSDVIKKVDNTVVNNVRELLNLVGKAEVGRKIKVAVLRDKKEVTLDLVIGERPQTEDLEGQAGGNEIKPSNWRGLEVESLDSPQAQQLKLEEKEGVLVLSVEPNSPTDDAGINPGDVILEINKEKIKNVSDYQKATRDLKGEVLVQLSRGYVVIKEKSEKE